MTDLAALIEERVLVGDGAMGTMLHAAGISLDRCLPELNLANPDLVRAVHDSYLAAGADVIQTNTFGASRLRLSAHGLRERARDVNLAGAAIALQARAAADRPVLVAGSVAAAVTTAQRGRVAAPARVEAIGEQVEALAEGGVDLLVFETFGHLAEMVEAVTAAAAICQLPIVAQMTFSDDGRTLSGETPGEVMSALAGLPVTIAGTNCTLGPQGVLGIVRELGRHTRLPLSAQPNAGLPRLIEGRRFQYTSDPDYFGRYARRCAEAGAVLVGGCCGTTPDHVRAAARAVADLRPVRRPRVAAPGGEPRTAPVPGERAPAGGLAEQLAAGRFVVAAEVTPPPGGRPGQAAELVAELGRRGVGVFLIAPGGGARAQMSPMSLALHVQQHQHVEAVLGVTTWDRTIMTLQADLLGVHALGVRSVICRTGSPPLRGDYPNVDGIWEVDSLGLIELLAGLNRGRDCNGLALESATSFCIGARCNPGAADLEAERERTRAKIAAGVQFLVTQPLYEPDTLRRLLEGLDGRRVPVLAAVRPLRSFAEAEYLRHEVPDVSVPDAVLEAMRGAGDDEEKGVRLAERLLADVRPLVDGIVLSPPPGAASAERLLRAIDPVSGPRRRGRTR